LAAVAAKRTRSRVEAATSEYPSSARETVVIDSPSEDASARNALTEDGSPGAFPKRFCFVAAFPR